jgi:hypothetical protein
MVLLTERGISISDWETLRLYGLETACFAGRRATTEWIDPCHSANGPRDFAQDHCKRRTTSLVKACHRSLEHFVLRNKIPSNLKTGLQSQLSNEFTLCPAVSLAKGM